MGAPPRANDLGVAEQEPIDAHLRNRTAREAHDYDSARLAQRSEAVGEAISSDRIDDEIDTAARELAHLVLPWAVGAKHLVRAGVARDLFLRIGGDNCVGSCTESLRDLKRRGANAAGSPMHEHALALDEPASQLEREVGGVIVEDQPRGLTEIEGLI